MTLVVAVDIGGTKLAGGVVGVDGTVSAARQRATPATEGPEAILDAVAALAREVAGGQQIDAIGVGTAGTVDATRGVIIGATDSLTDWCGTEVAAGLARRLSLDPRRVQVQNDVHAHALGEAVHGTGQQVRTMVFLAAGTGLGGAVVERGEVLRGARHVAGAVGHIPVPAAVGLRCGCGRQGHAEAVASGTGLHAAWLAGGGDPSIRDARGVVALATDGDARAVAAVTRSATGLAQAIAGIVTTLDPDLVVVGGGLAEAGELWWQAVLGGLRTELLDELQSVRIERSSMGTAAALAGAGRTAWMQLEADA